MPERFRVDFESEGCSIVVDALIFFMSFGFVEHVIVSLICIRYSSGQSEKHIVQFFGSHATLIYEFE